MAVGRNRIARETHLMRILVFRHEPVNQRYQPYAAEKGEQRESLGIAFRAENPAVASGRSSTKEMYVITPADNPHGESKHTGVRPACAGRDHAAQTGERPATSVRARAVSMDDRSGIS